MHFDGRCRIANARSRGRVSRSAIAAQSRPTNLITPTINNSHPTVTTHVQVGITTPSRSRTATRSANAARSVIITRSGIAFRFPLPTNSDLSTRSIHARRSPSASNLTILNLRRRRMPSRDHTSIIPNEVLLDIFEIVLSVNPRWVPEHAAPVRLSHVCKLWRTLVLAEAKLWTNIKITEAFYNSDTLSMTNFPFTLLRVEHFLEKSRKRALTIEVDLMLDRRVDRLNMANTRNPAVVNPSNFFRACVQKLSKLFSPHVRRFKSFTLSCNQPNLVADIQSCFSYIPMPLLESWVVRSSVLFRIFENEYNNSAGPTCTSKSELYTMFPRLRTAIFTDTPIEWSRFRPVHLTSLEIKLLINRERPDGEMIRQMLLACAQSLESLILHYAAPPTHAREPYEMLKLRHFELGYHDLGEIHPIIQDIRLLQLDDFTIEDFNRRFSAARAPSEEEVEAAGLLFDTMIEHLPLPQLQHLTLRHIISERSPPPSTATNLVTSSPSFRFLCQLVALKSLTLAGPDAGILNLLNYLPVVSGAEDLDITPIFRPSQVPLPALEVLQFASFEKHWDQIQLFLNNRIGRHNSYRRFNKLIFCDLATAKARSLAEDICQSVDLGLLTKSFEYIDPSIGSGFNFSHFFE